ncbi:Conserved_hypothetical protein [Hexamita inflata]|uniref:Lipid-binding serum glycoprotein N-terminal domain-containing protein n=1 Tax=Hexamita inflata TaxID=28002 RepID=A0AA86Q2Z7_9EUKA|nr:Conserved hypothetical protein [Hexamita inflata]
MLFLIISFGKHHDCVMDFPRSLFQNDSVQSSTANLHGAEQYLLCGIVTSLWAVFDIKIPDITLPISIAGMKIDFTLSEIKIANLETPDLKLDLNDNEQVNIFLPNCEASIKFVWKFQQQSYPYINDIGTGQIIIQNATMIATAGSYVDRDICPGLMKITVIHTDMSYDYFRIKLDDGQSWIFQSLIDIMMDSLQAEIQDFMSNTLVAGFLGLVNSAFDDGRRQYKYRSNEKIMKDERYVDNVQVGKGYISLLFAGYTYLEQNLTDEYITKSTAPITLNKYNADMQMAIKDEAFNNVFYIFHKYWDRYSSQDFKTVNPPKLRFVNTGALITMIVEVNGTKVEIELTAQPRMFDDLSRTYGKIYFEYNGYNIQIVEGVDTNLLMKLVIEHMNAVAQESAFQYNYTLMVDITKYEVQFDPKERVMRLIGDVPKECIPYK